MSTDYFYLKENTNELIEIGNSYSYSESYEELLKKLKSYQKKELSTIELQEKLYNWCLKEFDCDTDDSFFQFLIVTINYHLTFFLYAMPQPESLHYRSLFLIRLSP